MSKLWIAIVLALAVLPSMLAITINSVAIAPENATKTSTLSCAVNATDVAALSANVTWWVNGTAYPSSDQTISLLSGVENSTSAGGNIGTIALVKGAVWTCQASVFNSTDSIVENSSNVTILNSPPTIISPVTQQLVTEHSAYNQTLSVSDADGDPVIAYISSDLNSSLYSGAQLFTIGLGGQVIFTPGFSMIGNHTMALFAYDGQSWGGVNTQFTVLDAFDPPYFTQAPANQTAFVGVNFTLGITAAEDDANPLNFSVSASRPTIIINKTSNTTANLTFSSGAPILADVGLQQVNLTVYDTTDPTRNATATIYINVSVPNHPPVLANLSNQTGIQGQNFTLTVQAADQDVNDSVVFTDSTNCVLPNPWTIVTTSNVSTNATAVINLTLNNDNVVCTNVTITARDYDQNGVARGGATSVNLLFNITNINDPPMIFNISENITNYLGQSDMRNLTASPFAQFTYTVNASDPDQLTYEGDNITYSTNITLFTINASSGLITFMPNSSDIGNYQILVTVTDSNGSTANAAMNLTIISNIPPEITPIGVVTCQEKSSCVYDFSATSNNTGDLTFSFNDSIVTATQQSANTSEMNRTYTNNEVGNYSVILTVTDQYKVSNATNFTLIINNTNDAPFFDWDRDNISDALVMPSPVVVDLPTYWLINVTDPDFRNVFENLTFTANITSGTNTSLFTITKVGSTQALVNFTPGAADTGNYSANITVTDLAGAYDSRIVNFTIYNASLAPTITAAQPYNNGTVQVNSSLTPSVLKETSITFPENSTIAFNVSFFDPDTPNSSETVRYYWNGTLVSSVSGGQTAYSHYLDFFSAGSYNVTAQVVDDLLAQDNFTWHLTVTNVNRPPVLLSYILNRTINMTASLSNEMDHFIDPDDDLNSNNVLDINETNHLNYSMSPTPYLTATFTGPDVTLTPTLSGVTTVIYTAADPQSASTDSNNVTYTVFFNPNKQPQPQPISGGGGGGGGGGSRIVTIQVKTPNPYALDIIQPKPVTIYDNDTVIAPLTIKNTGTVDLSDIKLSAKTDANVTMKFSTDAISSLGVNQSVNTSLAIEGYRLQGTFEVYVTAHVGQPVFNDSTVLYINSMEKYSEGDAVNVKVTYARDFLQANPACGELVSLVDQAEAAYKNGDSTTGDKLLQSVSDGCVYLKSQAAKEVQAPTLLQSLAGNQYINFILAGTLILLLVIGGLLVAHYGRQQ